MRLALLILPTSFQALTRFLLECPPFTFTTPGTTPGYTIWSLLCLGEPQWMCCPLSCQHRWCLP